MKASKRVGQQPTFSPASAQAKRSMGVLDADSDSDQQKSKKVRLKAPEGILGIPCTGSENCLVAVFAHLVLLL